MLPNLPIPAQKARPLDLKGVEYDYVVKGYNICKIHFIARRETEIINTLPLQTKLMLSSAAIKKNIAMEFLRPNFYLSIILKVNSMLGIYPEII